MPEIVTDNKMTDKGRQKAPSKKGVITHKTERSGAAVLMHWMRQIIDDKDIDLGMPDVETGAADRKMPDIIIYESRRSNNVLCVIEAKPPHFDVFNEEELKEPARRKAVERKAKYFALTNFKKLIWYNTEKVNANLGEEEQIIWRYNLSDLPDINSLEANRYAESTKKALEEFLIKLCSVWSGKEAEPKLPIDELLTLRLYEKIQIFAVYYRAIIEKRCEENKEFRAKLRHWFIEQQWSFTGQPQDYDKIAHQAAYLLVIKILFYNVLATKRPDDLAPLEMPVVLVKGRHCQRQMQIYYDEVLEIDYEPIYSSNFIDSLCFPDSREVLREIRELILALGKYNLSKISYDIIGRIFERLIPPEERHNLGQYFTNSEVVDLILRFCSDHEDDIILDPSCGAGTFLVRAYYHKKLMNQRKDHTELLQTLWGNDIAKFPALLSIINLCIRDLSVDKNYPNILHEDFFALEMGSNGFRVPEKYTQKPTPSMGIVGRKMTPPAIFDAIVGNPPYTRQEEITEIAPGDKDYKENLIGKALLDINGKSVAAIGKRAGIHAYFFIHGTKFLKDGGHFGFVVSNSWLDVDYGKGLQEFFLRNYKIIAIIESKVERWFEQADINTCIIILEKCKNEKERSDNFIRFVYLKKRLADLFPPAEDDWDKQLHRTNAIDNIKKTILAHSTFYENEDLKIYPKSQKELWEEGFDPAIDEYVGSKWGMYLRIPPIYFKIMEKGKKRLIALKSIAKVRFGIKTGANEFFYLTEDQIEKRKIEKEFWMHKDKKGQWIPNYVIEKAIESDSIIIDPQILKKRVLFINKEKEKLKGRHILSYIRRGESNKLDERPTCSSRKPGRNWYDLGTDINDAIAFPERVRLRHLIFHNPHHVALNKNLYGISANQKDLTKALALVLNNTLTALYLELFARQPGGGGGPLDIDVRVAEEILVPNEALIEKYRSRLIRIPLDKRNINSIFKELGANAPEDVALEKVQPDRRELDRIIMGEILGLSEEEQLEVYRAVVDLVKSRIGRAGSVQKKNKSKNGIDYESFTESIMGRIGPDTLGKFYRENILTLKPLIIKELPPISGKVKIDHRLFEWRLYCGKKFVECRSELEARYLRVFIDTGIESVKLPGDNKLLEYLVPQLEEIKSRMETSIKSELESIMSAKTRERLRHLLWAEIIK